MKRLRPVFLLLAFSTLLLSLVQIHVSPAVFELSHDDGDFDYGWSDFYPSAAMVRFYPPSPSWRIKSIRLHAVCSIRGYGYFYLQVWDSNFNAKYSASFSFSEVFKNNVLDWYTIEIPSVVVTGEFYVVIIPMFTLDGSQLWISVDNDPPIANNSFIVNADTRETLVSMNATSRRPGDFMVRVVGEPAPVPPDLKLVSIEFNEHETIVVFTYPGEVKSTGARLVRKDGSFNEENVTRINERLIVKPRGEGTLNVFVVTPGNEIVGTSVRLETGLRTTYSDLLANYTVLKHYAEEMGDRIGHLEKENENLRLQLNQSQALIRIQDSRINELLTNVSSLRDELNRVRAEASRLGSEKNMLSAGLVISVMVVFLLGLVEVRRRWRKRS
ncbi:MAG: hypothetical protein QXI11_04345 [Thermoproteota archaeon]